MNVRVTAAAIAAFANGNFIEVTPLCGTSIWFGHRPPEIINADLMSGFDKTGVLLVVWTRRIMERGFCQRESKLHGEAPTLAARVRIGKPDAAAVPLYDRSCDREPKPGAGSRIARHAMESAEHALAIGRRNARPAVDHTESRRRTFAPHRDRDRGLRRRIAQRVVEQVLEQRAKLVFVSGDNDRIGRVRAEVHPESIRARRKAANRLPREPRNIDTAVRLLLDAVLEA